MTALCLPHSLRVETDDTTRLRSVVIEVHAGHVSSADSLSAEMVDTTTFVLEQLPDQLQLLSLTLPFPVDPAAATVKFAKTKQKLTLRAPELQQVAVQAPFSNACDPRTCLSCLSENSYCMEPASTCTHEQLQGRGGDEAGPDDIQLLREMYGDEVVSAPTACAAQQSTADRHSLNPGDPCSSADSFAQPRASHSPSQEHECCATNHATSHADLPTNGEQHATCMISQGSLQPHAPSPMPHSERQSLEADPTVSYGPHLSCNQASSTQSSSRPESTHIEPTTVSAHGDSKAIPAHPSSLHSKAKPTPSPAVAEGASLDCTNLASLLSTAFQKQSRPGQGPAKKTTKNKKTTSAMLRSIAGHLEQHGWVVCDAYVPLDQVIALRKEIKVMEDQYEPGEIWVGKEADVGATITRQDVRGDRVWWAGQQALEATAFVGKDGRQRKCSFGTLATVLQSIDRLITGALPALSPQLRHVRERSDAMCAIYPGQGARFTKHIDNTANDGRRLTLLCYLNPNWRDSQGGALRLFPPHASPVDVYPRAGRLAMFLSKTVAHEVMPTAAPRHSFTLWYYDALERAESVASARVAEGGAAGPEARQAARELLRDILAGDTGQEGALQVDEEGVAAFRLRIQQLPADQRVHVLSILASITGLDSPQAFQQSVDAMEPEDLLQLRVALSTMGMGHTPTV